jgi:nickel/cobalt transporter (NiCoT) family protein
MYPLGVLFGLGFDTATEIGLLGISAGEASKGLSLWSILVFPALFAAGMSLIDTTDNILMPGAFGWAFAKPTRKLYYNITITSVSVIVALAVGGIEALGLLAGKFHPSGAFWSFIGKLNDNFGLLGYGIIGLFAVSWIVSIAIYRWRRFDFLEPQQRGSRVTSEADLSASIRSRRAVVAKHAVAEVISQAVIDLRLAGLFRPQSSGI